MNQSTTTTNSDEELLTKIKQKLLKDIEEASAALETVPLDIHGAGPWSNSKYKTLKKCPFQYYLKYILKVKIPLESQNQDDPMAARVGTAAHEILELIMAGKAVDPAYAIAKKKYVDGKEIPLAIWETKVESLHYNISKFKERIDQFEKLNPIKRVFMEMKVGFNKNYEPVGFFAKDVWIRGVIDLVIMLESLDAIILDHKTGGNSAGIKNYEEQLDWYKVLLMFGIERVKGVQTGIHFIQEGEIKMASYSEANDIENKIKNTLEMSIEGALDMLKEHGYFKHIRGSQCKWCEYDNLGCKSGELLPIEKATKKWVQIIPQ